MLGQVALSVSNDHTDGGTAAERGLRLASSNFGSRSFYSTTYHTQREEHVRHPEDAEIEIFGKKILSHTKLKNVSAIVLVLKTC